MTCLAWPYFREMTHLRELVSQSHLVFSHRSRRIDTTNTGADKVECDRTYIINYSYLSDLYYATKPVNTVLLGSPPRVQRQYAANKVFTINFTMRSQ